jgi:DNA-binding response OmpR family regulator
MASTSTTDPKARLAHARHELRTPVNGIIGYSEMLLEDAEGLDEATFLHELGQIRDLGQQLLTGINKALDAARLEAPEALTLTALAEEAKARLQEPCRQVLRLCAKLLEEAQEPALTSFRPDLQRVGTAGAQLLALLDDPFGQPLASVAAPAAAPEASPMPSAEAPDHLFEDESEAPGLRGHILVVDDNQLNRELLARGLHRQGHYFALAVNGKQALEVLSSGAFDVVLLDIMMPEMDGFQVLQHIKADPRLKHTPVIMISALDDMAAVVRCIEMGAEDYLPKPFDPVLLQARVGACLEKKRLRDQELDYLRNVEVVTQAAAAVEAGHLDPDSLQGVARRSDALGQLARVFQSMVREVRAREERLQTQVQQLRIEIDEHRKAKQVAEITETSYFQELQEKAQSLRNRSAKRDRT